MSVDELVERVHGLAVAGARRRPIDRGAVDSIVRQEAPLLPAVERSLVADRVLHRVTGLGPLEPLLADPRVTDVLVNGPGPVWVERNGRMVRTEVDLDQRTIEHLIERVVGPLGLRVDRSTPSADARLPDGSRVNAVVPPVAVDGPCLTIRRFGARAVDLGEVAAPGVARLLEWAVAGRANVIVSGGSGAGKTTLLNTLATSIPGHERVVTVEDAAELRLPGPHVIRLEARPAGPDGAGEVTIRHLVRNALRMRPDRIVVGEVRGAEALDMVQAMNTGHDGSLSTCHANSPLDALRRLETMVLMADVDLPLRAVREQLASAVDLVVQIARAPAGRRVSTVAEVVGGVGGSVTTRVLGDGDGLDHLPNRPPRAVGAPAPDPEWLVT